VTEQLTLKYRPQRFDDMVGQRLTSVVLKQMVAEGSVPNAILFDGPRGTGKTSAARILAMELNPDERDNILGGTSLAVIEIDAASNGSVADIRSLVEQLRFSVGAEKRVVILDEAHSITREGFNALLKTLEEPPPGVIFVLVTTEPQKLPDTILSRVMEFEFRRVPPSELLTLVNKVALAEDIDLPAELATKLAEVADGSARDAIKNLDFIVRADIKTVEQFDELTGRKDVGPILFASLLTGDHSKIFKVFDELMMQTGDPRVVSNALSDLITDLFILLAGGEVSASGKALEHRIKLAQLVSVDALYAAVSIIWDLKTRVRASEDQRTALAAALVLVSNKLVALREVETKTADTSVSSEVASEQNAPHVLSLSEIQQM
jgi:DNA polymerase-3 subunit gamma/tau